MPVSTKSLTHRTLLSGNFAMRPCSGGPADLHRRRVAADNAAMETESTKTESPRRTRRWFQFSLRTLLIGVTIAATFAAVPWYVSVNGMDDSAILFNVHGFLLVASCWLTAWAVWRYFSTLEK